MNLKNTGILVIDRTYQEEWGKVVVDEKLRQHNFDVLELNNFGYKLPDYEAHISVFTKEETQMLPLYIPEEGKQVSFELSFVKIVEPTDWDGVDNCFILCVECPALKKLRMKYGFSPLMHGDHEFHITIGTNSSKCDRSIRPLINVFNRFIEDEM